MAETPQSSEYVLVVDLGTSGPKVGLVDQQGHVAACAGAPVKLFFLPEGGAEHDPRAYVGMAVTYALSPRGACHMEGNMYDLDLGQSNLEDVGLVAGDRHDNSAEKGRMAARLQAWRNLSNSLTLCEFENPPVPLLVGAINAATGWHLNGPDLMTLGKDIVNIKRLLNFKLGLTRADDRLPEMLLKPLKEGGSAGHVPDVPTLLAGAYAEFGWDPVTGRPPDEWALQA